MIAGRTTRAADGLDHAMQSVYDALDRLVSTTDATGAVTQYGYDADDNLTSVTDARGLATTYAYDGFGCLRQQSSPDTGTTTFACNLAGDVTSRTDARGVTTTYNIDALGRTTSAVYSGAPSETAFYGYDVTANGNKGIGRLTAAQNDGADIARQYDARGNVVEERRTIGGVLYVTAYGYDRADRLTSVTYPGGRVVTYVRNAAGQGTSVTTTSGVTGNQTVAQNVIWAPFGGLESLTYGNGLYESRIYNGDGFLTDLSVGTLISRNYARDAAGRITLVDDAAPGADEAYGYSDVDRLTSASGPFGTQTFNYDGVGNRLGQNDNGSSSTLAYDSASNRLQQVSGAINRAYTYDPAGNTVARGNMTLAYNAANRLQSLTLSGGQALTFAYSALGERVVKTSAQGTTHFHYDLAGHLIAESDATGAVIREYLWLGDKPLAMVAKRNAGTTFELFAVHTDHLDTALALTDSTQQVVWQYAREPFGKLAAGGNTVRWNLRFPGQYQDTETGLFYNYFRDYDAQIGRYIESDPIGLDGGINTYAYVSGYPIQLTDEEGLAGKLPDWTGGWPKVAKEVVCAIKDACTAERDREKSKVDDRSNRRAQDANAQCKIENRHCLRWPAGQVAECVRESGARCLQRHQEIYDDWKRDVENINKRYKAAADADSALRQVCE